VNVAQVIQKAALMIVARRGAGVTKLQDLAGRRVGLWGGDFDVPHIALFKKFNVRPEIVNQSYSIAPFLRGAVNVTSAMYYNEYHKLFEAGLLPTDLQTFTFSDYGLNFPEDGIYCAAATRRDRAAICSAVVSASLKGWAYAIAHEAEALDIVMKYCNDAQLATNRNHQRWMLRAMSELIQHRVGKDPAHWGTLTQEDYDNVAGTLKAQGLIEKIPAYAEFYQPALAQQEPKP
jgi:NitT/TauT family transport system substrate-binding protein